MLLSRPLSRFKPLRRWLEVCIARLAAREFAGVYHLANTIAATPPISEHEIENPFENLLQIDCDYYRSLYADLRDMDHDGLRAHYRRHGFWEGRVAHELAIREAFLAALPSMPSLEIGPFFSPTLRGSHVKYADVLSTAELRERAEAQGFDKRNVPEIDFVLEAGNLKDVDERFDLVFSSHCIEHQPNLIGHLIDVASLLNEGGKYALVIPDARFCFDASLPLSCISEVLQAYQEDRKAHSMASFIEHFALTTHNFAQTHWATNLAIGNRSWKTIDPARLKAALESWELQSGYTDVHAWQFQPISFAEIVHLLISLNLIPFKKIECHGTTYGQLEFMATLAL